MASLGAARRSMRTRDNAGRDASHSGGEAPPGVFTTPCPGHADPSGSSAARREGASRPGGRPSRSCSLNGLVRSPTASLCDASCAPARRGRRCLIGARRWRRRVQLESGRGVRGRRASADEGSRRRLTSFLTHHLDDTAGRPLGGGAARGCADADAGARHDDDGGARHDDDGGLGPTPAVHLHGPRACDDGLCGAGADGDGGQRLGRHTAAAGGARFARGRSRAAAPGAQRPPLGRRPLLRDARSRRRRCRAPQHGESPRAVCHRDLRALIVSDGRRLLGGQLQYARWRQLMVKVVVAP